METWTAITSRRNVRNYLAEPVAEADLEQILEAARRAPSAFNAQWWDLVVVTDKARLDELSGVWRGAGHVARSAVTVAVIAPVGKDAAERSFIQYDLGQMTMQMMIAATDLGVGSAHAHVDDQGLARRILDIPPDRVCVALVALGYPSGRALRPIRNPARRDLEDVVHREVW